MPMALPFIGQEFHLSPTVLGAVISVFFVGYATMQIPGGMLADRIGPRKSITLGIAFWSGFSVLTGLAGNLVSLLDRARRASGSPKDSIPPPHSKRYPRGFPRTNARAPTDS